ncbi:CDGSH iron-sulfur domain-containing protein [Micromonospora chersina]|uniref:CDGSH iron-sulfur domain-containing protein n=1 Tax=Micromonospora chersina TaxID=47854 RepID=UPI0033D68243
MTAQPDRAAATITPYPDGPLVVRGDFAVTTPDGRQIDVRRRTIALCRCGKSAITPFCDGTHKALGFRVDSDPAPTDSAGPAD